MSYDKKCIPIILLPARKRCAKEVWRRANWVKASDLFLRSVTCTRDIAKLMRALRPECDLLVSSIFINPTQFAEHEDLDTYPRSTVEDLNLCRVEKNDLVFLPKSGRHLCGREEAADSH